MGVCGCAGVQRLEGAGSPGAGVTGSCKWVLGPKLMSSATPPPLLTSYTHTMYSDHIHSSDIPSNSSRIPLPPYKFKIINFLVSIQVMGCFNVTLPYTSLCFLPPPLPFDPNPCWSPQASCCFVTYIPFPSLESPSRRLLPFLIACPTHMSSHTNTHEHIHTHLSVYTRSIVLNPDSHI